MSIHLTPDLNSLPSNKQLLKATGIAAVIAAAVLVFVILPSEYGLDPTGVGKVLGFTSLAGSTEAPAPAKDAPAAAANPEDAVRRSALPFRAEEKTVTLAPGKGAEIKALMKKGEGFVFSWTASGGAVNFDMHGDIPNDPSGDFTSFWLDQGQTAGHGSFTAPFDGGHGWYWGNKTDQPVTVTVKVSGFYDKLYQP